MKLGRSLQNRSGMTLVEVMMGVLIVAIVSSALTAVLMNAYKMQTRVELKEMVRQLGTEVREIVAESQCGIPALLSGANSISVTDGNWDHSTVYNLSEIRGLMTTVKSASLYDRLQIESIQISPRPDMSGAGLPAYKGAESGDPSADRVIGASIRVNVTGRVGEMVLPFRPIYTPIYLTLDSDRSKIIGCKTGADSIELDRMCSVVGGTWNELSGKCALPCPNGMAMVDGNCVSGNDSGNDDFYQECDQIVVCGVSSKYIMN